MVDVEKYYDNVKGRLRMLYYIPSTGMTVSSDGDVYLSLKELYDESPKPNEWKGLISDDIILGKVVVSALNLQGIRERLRHEPHNESLIALHDRVESIFWRAERALRYK